MDTTRLAAFVCYAFVSLASTAFGITYLVRSRFLPYHEEALGIPWQQLDPRLQALLLGLMRAAGGGLLGAGISSAILLLIPFRAGETWSLLALPAIGLATALPMLYATILIRRRTQAHTPVLAGVLAVGLIVVGFILSMI